MWWRGVSVSISGDRPAGGGGTMLELGRIAQPLRSLNERILTIFVVDPSSGRTLGYVDGLRAIAVSLVVALHCWGRAQASLVLALPLLPAIDFTTIVSHGGYG